MGIQLHLRPEVIAVFAFQGDIGRSGEDGSSGAPGEEVQNGSFLCLCGSLTHKQKNKVQHHECYK